MNLEDRLKQCLVFDIETSSNYPDGREINISANFDEYVDHAEVKWFGCYSYRYKKSYYLNAVKDRAFIRILLQEHSVLVGFNSADFDYPILVNNGLTQERKKYLQIDCLQILGKSTFMNKSGYSYKDRGTLMGYKFKNNQLRNVAEAMGLETQKGDIDYEIFNKFEWTEEETKEIIKYLSGDVMATKEMFDKLHNYWKPFTEFLYSQHINDYSWIRSSIASLIYKSACFIMGVEVTYAEVKEKVKERMGGNVIEPKYEEAKNVWYVDFASLYPHIMCMFNLFNEVPEQEGEHVWHGNDLFKVKGYYNIYEPHILSKAVQKKLKQRQELKKSDKDNPLIYTIKIWLNGLYGVIRSALFEKVHTPNAGWDTAWLGQQIQKLTETMMDEFGFESIAGDTDSIMVVARDEKDNNKEYVQQCLRKIVTKILDNVPFPVDTYNIDIDEFCYYMLFPFSDQELVDEKTRKLLNKGEEVPGYLYGTNEEGKKVIFEITPESEKLVKLGRSWVKEYRGKKKNYMYIYKNSKDEMDIKIVGLPIKKDNATKLGIKIYNDILKPQILEKMSAKFTKEYIDGEIEKLLKNKEIMDLLSREFKVKPFCTYKVSKGKSEPTGIHAQISKGYFNKGDGVVRLIKNNKYGNAGCTAKYCTVEEAIEHDLTIKDIDLDKVYSELSPFIINNPKP